MGLTFRMLIALAVLVMAAPELSPASLDASSVGATRRPWPSPLGAVAGTVARPQSPIAEEADDAGDQSAEQTDEDTSAEEAPPAVDDSVDDGAIAVLRRQELAARDLNTFTAKVVYETTSGLLGDSVLRTGRIIYRAPLAGESTASPNDKALAIRFDAVIENRRKRERVQEYVFAGRWLVEKDAEQKLFIKREVAPPGETFDPFKLGEGPIPLPIGQPAEEVLKRFTVATTDPPTTGRLAKLAGRTSIDGIRLVPRPGTKAAEDIERVDLFYDRETNLPIGVSVVETNGDTKTARLDEIKRNVALDAETIELLSVETPDEPGWTIDLRPLES